MDKRDMFKKKVKPSEPPKVIQSAMTVKELLVRLADADPDGVVLLSVQGGPEDRFEDIEIGLPNRRRSVRLWGDRYQTREVGNAYTANDDRYGGPAFVIEVGEESP